jgi:hypothetical protein
MFEVDPQGTAGKVASSESDRPDPTGDGPLDAHQASLAAEAERLFDEQIARATKEPGAQVADRLFRKGGCILAPLYLALSVLSWHAAGRFATWATDRSSGWWFPAWMFGFLVASIVLMYPISWLDEKLFPEAHD